MAKEKQELSLMEEASTKMETMVEQHNELVQTIQEQQGRLAEVKQMLVEHQGNGDFLIDESGVATRFIISYHSYMSGIMRF